MKSYFRLESLDNLENYFKFFSSPVEFSINSVEYIKLEEACGRIIAEDVFSDQDIPGFKRSTMDGFAIKASESFGASESSPLMFRISGIVNMGEVPNFIINSGEVSKISTGGMLPEGADSVVMIEFTEKITDDEVNILKPVAPGTNIVNKNDDFSVGEKIFSRGEKISSKNIGFLAAAGKTEVGVFKKPSVCIISTGDEVVSADKKPEAGEIRDINRYTLSSMIRENGASPFFYDIVKDSKNALSESLIKALKDNDIVIISGGSSIGARDITIEAINSLDDSEILFHGVSMSPGKPVILGRVGEKPVFGLPGHPVSCFVSFMMVVTPFLDHIKGLDAQGKGKILYGRSSRNIYSEQGRRDFIRVRLEYDDSGVTAHPILGESGLIRTLGNADGLLEIPEYSEGILKGEKARIHLL